MDIYVVRPGDTVYSIAAEHEVSMSLLLANNQFPDPTRLVVGQTVVIQYPQRTYIVQSGDTLDSIANFEGISINALLRNNPVLRGENDILPGQELVLSYQQPKQGTLSVNGYAYPYVDRGLLQRTLPYLTNLTPFTYGFTSQGELVMLNDQFMLDAAAQMRVAPLLHLSTLSADGRFSNELAHIVLNDSRVQNTLIENLMRTIQEKNYRGLDVDFEFVFTEDAVPYAQFIARLRERLSPLGLPVIVALAPKVFASQPGLLYQGHNYRLLSEAADQVLLMTYEWGYTYSAPMAVAPIRKVRQVVEYALTEMPPEKIWLGIPML